TGQSNAEKHRQRRFTCGSVASLLKQQFADQPHTSDDPDNHAAYECARTGNKQG
ncbi:hypothetical protein K7432_012234, partial [Basidiobolus ranarum]